MAVNTCAISGNLTRDSELKATKGGTPVLTFSVAVNERRKDPSSGEWDDYPNFIGCVLFGKRAESLADYLKKGTKVSLSGHLHFSSWMKDDEHRSRIDIYVDAIDLMSYAKKQDAQAKPSDLYDDDMPF